MAITVVDKDNFQDFMQGKAIAPEPDEPKKGEVAKPASTEAKVDDKGAKTPQKVTNETDIPDDDFAKLTESQQKTVNRKHRAMKEADEFAEDNFRKARIAEKRADAAEARLSELESKAQPTKAEAKAPERKDFESDEAFWDAKIEWKAAEAVQADRVERAREQAVEAERAVQADFERRRESGKKQIADWDEVMAEVDDGVKANQTITHYLRRDADDPAALMYHFAKHPDELDELNSLRPSKAIAALGKLEAKLEAKEVIPPKVKADAPAKPRAPEPIAPLANGAGGPVQKSLEDWTVQDHKDYEDARRASASTKRQRH